MRRIYSLQQWYALSGPAAEVALHDSQAMRRFVGLDLGREGAPNESTIWTFRHLLAQPLLYAVSVYPVSFPET